MNQTWLPLFDNADDGSSGESADSASAAPPAEPLPARKPRGQVALFSRFTERVGEMFQRIEEGEFEQAAERRRALLRAEGPSKDAQATEFLEQWGTESAWTRPPADVLEDWRALDATIGQRGMATFRRIVRTAVVNRLLRAHTAAELVAADPSCLPAVVNVLAASEGADAVNRAVAARALVRDALVAGRALAPNDFEDERIAELLAEDLEPEWMAVAGALSALWPCPPVGDGDAKAVRGAIGRGAARTAREQQERRPRRSAAADASSAETAPAPARGDHDRALFWAALRVVADRGQDAALRADARRLMKRLNAPLHAAVMRTSWAR